MQSRRHVPKTYSGMLDASSAGAPLQTVELLVDGVVSATTTTDPFGAYSAALTFATPGTYLVQAVAYRATALETLSAALSVIFTPTPQITAGGHHTCALISDGTARCWGSNGFGQLEDGTTTQRLAPVTVVDLP